MKLDEFDQFGGLARFGHSAGLETLASARVFSSLEVDRSGFRDPLVRFAVNLYGVPAMGPREIAARKVDL